MIFSVSEVIQSICLIQDVLEEWAIGRVRGRITGQRWETDTTKEASAVS